MVLPMKSSVPTLLFFVVLLSCQTTQPVASLSLDPIPDIDTTGTYLEYRSYRNAPDIHQQRFTLGDTEIILEIYEKGEGPTYVNLHDDENTSVAAALEVIDSLGGRLVQLKHGGHRNLEFHLDELHHYEVDPNRMFTDVGTWQSMVTFGDSTLEAYQKVRNLARSVIDHLDTRMVVALHNNTEAKYSAASYMDIYENEAEGIHLNPIYDLDDFFFVTDIQLFAYFQNLNYNVVLQNNETMTDDGSLSVYCGSKGIPYVNVEAQHGNYLMQVRMLRDFYRFYEKLEVN